MHYVYVLQDRNTYYIGYTKNIEQRMGQHERLRPEFTLVYYEAYPVAKIARLREQRLKQYGSAWRGLKQRLQSA